MTLLSIRWMKARQRTIARLGSLRHRSFARPHVRRFCQRFLVFAGPSADNGRRRRSDHVWKWRAGTRQRQLRFGGERDLHGGRRHVHVPQHQHRQRRNAAVQRRGDHPLCRQHHHREQGSDDCWQPHCAGCRADRDSSVRGKSRTQRNGSSLRNGCDVRCSEGYLDVQQQQRDVPGRPARKIPILTLPAA